MAEPDTTAASARVDPPRALPPRAVVEGVRPIVDGGRFPVKRIVGEPVVVQADAFAEGHDLVAAALRYGPVGGPWSESPMRALGNDRFEASFVPGTEGRWRYTVVAWVDRFGSWRRDLERRLEAGQDVAVDLRIGAELLRAAARGAGDDAAALRDWASRLAADDATADVGLDPALADLAARAPDRGRAGRYDRELELVVDRPRARFTSWYELFPRSAGPPGAHGTLADTRARLPYVAAMGFDVLYLPPIHPIGRAVRKGPNNTVEAGPDDVGSPWAIGADEGGHTAVHPALGTVDDVDALVAEAAGLGIEVALDLAFQCAPDHPWVREHPSWFRHRPDGTIQYAENPPKRYQDIYPLDFESRDWRALWEALRDVVRFWVDRGVRIFRVDNPHTKPFAFWEWLIRTVKEEHPDVLFLSEAFTRPRVMERLAKLGFTQSYTYFTWRTTKAEIEEYASELSRPELVDAMRPSFWPNTPDILPFHLQGAHRGTFVARLVLAATLSASYGIYGPAYELMDNRPLAPGREEYLDSEKFQVRAWDTAREDSLAELIGRVNAIRRRHPALQRNDTLRFLPVDNDALVAYAKTAGDDAVIVVVNIDPDNVRAGWLQVPLEALGLPADRPYAVLDLLGGERYVWHGPTAFVQLDPHVLPAHVLHVRADDQGPGGHA